MFFDETCTISQSVSSIVDGEEAILVQVIETDVPCAFYSPSNSYSPGTLAQQQGTEAYTLVLPSNKAFLAIKGRRVTVGGGEYLVNAVQTNKYPSGAIDNAECSLVQRDVQ